jgi:hypothetical protein
VAFWTSQLVSFTLVNWATISFISSGADQFSASGTDWGWSWFTNSRFASAFVAGFNDHLARSTRSDLDGWTKFFNASFLSWATTFGSFDQTDSFFDFALVTLHFFDLWTVQSFFVATVAWQAFVSCATFTGFWFDSVQKLTLVTFCDSALFFNIKNLT